MEHTSTTAPEEVATGELLVRRLRDLLPELRDRYHVVDVSVFGSRVRADATAESDLDLLVTFDTEASLFDLIGMELDLEARLGIHVDVVEAADEKGLTTGALGLVHCEARDLTTRGSPS